jgi:hypothetical protein
MILVLDLMIRKRYNSEQKKEKTMSAVIKIIKESILPSVIPSVSLAKKEPEVFQPQPILPGLSNVIGAPFAIKETCFALKTSIQIGNTSTRNAALVRIFSALLSFFQAIISFLQNVFSFLRILPTCGLLALALSCNITALVLCSTESLVEAYHLLKQLVFFKKPFFIARKFLSLSSSKNQKDSLESYIAELKNNRSKFEKFFEKKRMQTFLDDLETFKTNLDPSKPLREASSEFQKMKRSVLQLHLDYFHKKYFTYSPNKQRKISELQREISLLNKYKLSPLHKNIPALQGIFQKYQPKNWTFTRNRNLTLPELISFLTEKKKLLESHLSVARINLSKNLGSTLVQNLFDNYSRKAPSSTDPAQAEKLFHTLKIQTLKKALLHLIGLIAIILALAGFILLISNPAGAASIPIILFAISTIIGFGRYFFEKSVLNEPGWHVGWKKSIPEFLLKIFQSKTKIPTTLVKV